LTFLPTRTGDFVPARQPLASSNDGPFLAIRSDVPRARCGRAFRVRVAVERPEFAMQ
jgi:hypothetical protein